jgi:hypothetical protein
MWLCIDSSRYLVNNDTVVQKVLTKTFASAMMIFFAQSKLLIN